MAAGSLPDELAGVLSGIQRMARRRLWHGLPGPRPRGAQVELMRLVTARPGIGVSAAARELCLAANTVSTLVNQLMSAGLLRREADPGDGRAVLLFPTPSCGERLRDWDARRAALFREHVRELTDEDRAALVAALPALRRLAASMRAAEPV
ncbi:MarR family winged helix-turn-helix transcriptional regulator [Streptomyces abikoensis]|uniref:MarR family winged helix-turn-helix transcriptional regulator n=1 Tax=Streptomyces abikoensis TaxID=97398 RepID=UPI00340BCE24